MRGDEVDAVDRPAAVVPVQVGASRQPRGERGCAAVTAPEAAHVVAEAVVELRPAVAGKLADLIGAGGVPRLGDDLGVSEHRVLADPLKDRRVGAEVAGPVASEHGGEVEPETVDVHLHRPVVEAFDDQLPHHRMVAVERVVAAGEVQVAARILGVEQVVDAVVQAPVGERGPVRASLRGVVEHHVQDHLDAGGVHGLDHFLELAHLAARLRSRGVAALGGEQADRVVGPVVDQRLAGGRSGGVLVRLGHRQQLDRGHAQLVQVRDALDEAAERAGVGHLRGGMDGEAAHVGLVDDRPRKRMARRPVVTPVEGFVHHQAARAVRGQVRGPQPRREGAGERLGVGVEQRRVRVEAVTGGRLMGTVHPVQVGVAGPHPVDDDVPDVAGAVQRNPRARCGALRVVEQQQGHARGMPAEQRKLRGAVEHGRPQRLRPPVTGVGRAGRAVHRSQWVPPAGAGAPDGGRQSAFRALIHTLETVMEPFRCEGHEWRIDSPLP